jgi:hypothetical protein
MAAVPVVTELGLAVTFTVGAVGGGVIVVATVLPPHEVRIVMAASAMQLNAAARRKFVASASFAWDSFPWAWLQSRLD